VKQESEYSQRIHLCANLWCCAPHYTKWKWV